MRINEVFFCKKTNLKRNLSLFLSFMFLMQSLFFNINLSKAQTSCPTENSDGTITCCDGNPGSCVEDSIVFTIDGKAECCMAFGFDIDCSPEYLNCGSTSTSTSTSGSTSTTSTSGSTGTAPDSVSFSSLILEGDQLKATYSKNFDACLHAFNENLSNLISNSNLFCPKGENVQGQESVSKFNVPILDGTKIKFCHGNNGNICGVATVQATSTSSSTTSSTSTSTSGVCPAPDHNKEYKFDRDGKTNSVEAVFYFKKASFPTPNYADLKDDIKVSVADINLDNFNDLILATHGSSGYDTSVDFLLNNEGKSFSASRFDLGVEVGNVTVSDLNNDNTSDLVFSKPGLPSFYIGLNKNGSIEKSSFIQSTNYFDSVAVGDFRKDCKKDVFALKRGSVDKDLFNSIIVNYNSLSADINKMFGSSSALLNKLQKNGSNLKTFDANNDGNLDLIHSTFDAVVIAQSDKNNNYDGVDAKIKTIKLSSSPEKLAIGYINADDLIDVAVSTYNSSTKESKLIVLLASDSGEYSQSEYNLPSFKPADLVLGDFDNDGDLDAASITNTKENKTVSLLKNLGEGNFDNSQELLLDANKDILIGTPTSLAATDINNDGKIDLVIAGIGVIQVLYQDDAPKNPEIVSLSKTKGKAGDEVTVKVNNVAAGGALPDIYFGSVKAQLQGGGGQVGGTSVDVSVVVPAGSGTVKVKAVLNEKESNTKDFTYVVVYCENSVAKCVDSTKVVQCPTGTMGAVCLGTGEACCIDSMFACITPTCVTAPILPVITSVSPNKGKANDQVTISGSGILGGKVYFGMTEAVIVGGGGSSSTSTGGSSTSTSSSTSTGGSSTSTGGNPTQSEQLFVRVPSGLTGKVDVSVVKDGQTSANTAADDFTYVIVYCENSVAKCVDSTKVVQCPSGTMGAVCLPGNGEACCLNAQFNCIAPTCVNAPILPVITSVSPNKGKANDQVTISGSGILGGKVYFGMTEAVIVGGGGSSSSTSTGGSSTSTSSSTSTGGSSTSTSSSTSTGGNPTQIEQLLVKVPSGLSGKVDVSVVKNGQTSANTTADDFTYLIAYCDGGSAKCVDSTKEIKCVDGRTPSCVSGSVECCKLVNGGLNCTPSVQCVTPTNPEIISLSKTKGKVGDSITVKVNNVTAGGALPDIYFGSVKAQLQGGGGQVGVTSVDVIVVVPAGSGTVKVKAVLNGKESNTKDFTYVVVYCENSMAKCVDPTKVVQCPTGTVNGPLCLGNGEACCLNAQFNCIAPTCVNAPILPVITSVSPNKGKANDQVTISGSGILGGKVYFGMTEAVIVGGGGSSSTSTGGSSTSTSSSTSTGGNPTQIEQLLVKVPSGLSGKVDVSVVKNGQTSANTTADDFTYVIAYCQNGMALCVDSTKVVQCPVGTMGAVCLNTGEACCLDSTFACIAPTCVNAPILPVITSVSPNKGKANDQVTISGSGILGGKVYFGMTEAVIVGGGGSSSTSTGGSSTSTSSSTSTGGNPTQIEQLLVKVPSGLSGKVDVSVVKNGQTSANTTADDFTYVIAYCQNGTAKCVDSTKVVQCPSGSVKQCVGTGGQACCIDSMTFECKAPSCVDAPINPELLSLTPGRGKLGDQVDLLVKNVPMGAKVFFGGNEATIVGGGGQSGSSEQHIFVNAPAGSGTVKVKVAGDGKESNTKDFTYVIAYCQNGTAKCVDSTKVVQCPSGSVKQCVGTGGQACCIDSMTFECKEPSCVDAPILPVITSVSPNRGKANDQVTISGSGILGGKVYFGMTEAVIVGGGGSSSTSTGGSSTSTSSSTGGPTQTEQLLVKVPSGLSGKVDVSVVKNGQTSANTTADDFTYLIAYCDGSTAKCVDSTKEIKCVDGRTPSCVSGSVECCKLVNGGLNCTPSVQCVDVLVPEITSPFRKGYVGDEITLTGNNFVNVQSVNFESPLGSAPATSFMVVDSSTIKIVVPAVESTVGAQIRITNNSGTSAISESSKFAYFPEILSLSKSTGKAGDRIDINGRYFGSRIVLSVRIGNKILITPGVGIIDPISHKKINIRVPLQDSQLTGKVNVKVVTTVGESKDTVADDFTYSK